MMAILLWIVLGIFVLVALVVSLLTLRFLKGKRRVEQQWQAMKPVKITNFGSTKTLEVLPLIDWNTAHSGLHGEAGVSYLIKTDAITILFDVGLNAKHSDPSPLLQNMETLGVKLDEIDAIVISHNHLDHVGGLTWQRQKSFSLTRTQIDLGNKRVYTPVPMTYPGLSPIYSQQPTIIADGVALTGTLPGYLFFIGAVEEQTLAVNVQGKGIVLIVGCGHQTLSKLLPWVEQVFDEPLYGIIGGLHYPVTDGNSKILGIPVQKHVGTGKVPWRPIIQEELHANIQLLQRYAPQLVGLSPHDSCKVSIEAFRHAFGDDFKDIVVGKTIKIGR